MIVKNPYPILEYSTEKTAVINSKSGPNKVPRLCLVTFLRKYWKKW